MWEHGDKKIYYQAGSYYNITFTNDSFYYRERQYADSETQDTCSKSDWVEYAKGFYSTANNKIYFSGYWTDRDYKNFLDKSCYRIGSFNRDFEFEFLGKDSLLLKTFDNTSKQKNTIFKYTLERNFLFIRNK